MLSRGLLTIHTCPMALLRHVEWSIQSILGPVSIDWRSQPLIAGTQRTQVEWRAKNLQNNGEKQGSQNKKDADRSAELASALKSWHYLRFEITYATQIFRHTPDLGLHRAEMDEVGNILVTENQIRNALKKSDDELRELLDKALGTEWDMELEPFRGVDLQEITHLRAI